MKFDEDPRIRVSRKILALAWLFFSLYLAAIMGLSFNVGTEPYLWGLPRWVAIGNIIVPVVFVLLLIFVAERFIPDVPMTEDTGDTEEER
ncbi:MAG: DUF997 family protein [Gemmatimonadota bacterium]|nr:MAG: DUF997 family protein [Gemmatimonadota bacterium]